MTANNDDRVQSLAPIGFGASAPQADVDQDTRKMLNKNKTSLKQKLDF